MQATRNRTTPARRLAAFAVVLAAVFGLAALAGAAIGPEPERGAGPSAHGEGAMAMDEARHGGGKGSEGQEPTGLSASDQGLRLELAGSSTFPAGAERTLRFRVLDDHGDPVHEFADEHGARLHLIVVRRDLTGYQHLHPRLARDGTWSVELTLPRAGAYRAFADFHSGGKDLTLGTDLFAPGSFEPRELPRPATEARVDGYDVQLADDGKGELRFTVSRDGRAVTALQPYLGARGHLVALREGDLAYLHVHPQGDGAGHTGHIAFATHYPTPGRYRLFLQFKHAGSVHTVAFTREVAR